MKKFHLLLVVGYLLFTAPVNASGKKDAVDAEYLNNEWLLCITEFDYSMLSSGRRIAGDVITRNLVDKLKTVNYRLRISPEYAYYEGYAWQQSVNTAAKALLAKQNERSLLLYRGEPDWKYRANIKKIDADIEKLTETLAEKEAERPLIQREPSFGLSQANVNGTYPAPPKPGGERRFCQNQKTDAILMGAISEFHGRYFISLKLFTLYTNSYIYEDDIIFSMEDTDGAVEEITARLTTVLSGNRPAHIAVTADPSESQILLNQNYAGRGTVEEREYPPGQMTVAVGAEGFSPETIETELIAGELTDIEVTLSPLFYSDVNIGVLNSDGAHVYLGALYVGESPLTLRLPVDQLEYVTVDNQHERGKAVFTTPELPDDSSSISLKTKLPRPAGEKRVNKARRWYYWAWGGTWITGITAWITYGIYSSRNDVLSKSNDVAFFESTRTSLIISTGALITLGSAIAYESFHIGRYLYTATEDVTPIVRKERNRK